MAKFNEMEYKRPDMEEVKAQFEATLEAFSNASNAEEQAQKLQALNDLRMDFETQQTIAHIRFTQDTTNEAYKEEYSFFNEQSPIFASLEHRFRQALLNSPYRAELENRFGKHMFNLHEAQLKTHKPEIESLLQEENRLTQEYTQLLASAKIDFRGEKLNLPKLSVYLSDPDRETRKEAFQAKYAFMNEQGEKLDQLYDDLVKTRHRMARKLGFESFTPLAYARMQRTDYGPEDVERFRESIHKRIVPLATKLRKKQGKWLGLDKLKFYDEPLKFTSGNPKPKGDEKWVIDRARQMYSDLAPETEEFFEFMLNNDLMDLENRNGKAGGGYCTFIANHKAPFIFANFNGTSNDVRVLTHEIGHAFQIYSSRNKEVPEYYFPTMEAAEIHSMSMEFLTLPWMGNFFKDDEAKFKYKLLSDRILFLPYGVAVDEFQHYVYDNPNASPEMRKKKWKELERKYLPHRDYDGEKFLEEGSFWQQQQHIYNSPFYYIDYTLAEICAMQFWVRSLEDSGKVLDDYIELCQAGGSKPFTTLVEQANLTSPFGEEAIATVVGQVEKWLNSLDEEMVK